LEIIRNDYTTKYKGISNDCTNLLDKIHKHHSFEKESLLNKKLALEVQGLWKKYWLGKTFALKDVNIKIYEGDIHGLIGKNGAGKTTLMKILVGALNATKGYAKIYDVLTTNLKSKEFFGYTPEKAVFYKSKLETTRKYLVKFAKLNQIKKSKIEERVDEVIEFMGIKKLEHLLPYKLSSGEKKKILIAQSLLKRPKVLIFDEPTANLDPSARIDILEKLSNLAKTRGTTILISSHILLELEKYITGWTIIDEGEIIVNKSYGNRKSSQIKYVLSTRNNLKAVKFLKHWNPIFRENNKEIIISINRNEKGKLKKEIFSLPVRIKYFDEEKVNLSRLFNKHVGTNDE